MTRGLRPFGGASPPEGLSDYSPPSSMVSPAQVRRIALSLPGTYEQTSYEGRPSWRTKPRMFSWIRPDPEALVVWVDSLDAKDAMIASEPHTFFTTPHYDGHPIVLVRLEAIDGRRARELILESWRIRAPRSLVKLEPGGRARSGRRTRRPSAAGGSSGRSRRKG